MNSFDRNFFDQETSSLIFQTIDSPAILLFSSNIRPQNIISRPTVKQFSSGFSMSFDRQRSKG